MWPLVQSGDACTFHPIQAVTAHGPHELNKEASEIHVGDVVFRQVQRMQQLFGHIVLRIAHDRHAREPKYWIGNTEQRVNGWCFREHIYGILVECQAPWEGHWYRRPLPHTSVPGGAVVGPGSALEPSGQFALPVGLGRT